jgi:hypothetical protein
MILAWPNGKMIYNQVEKEETIIRDYSQFLQVAKG